MRRTYLLAPLLAVVLLTTALLTPVLAQLGPFTIAVGALVGSNISGTATLAEPSGGSTRVDVQLTTAGDHPMHIHEGPCASADPNPWYALHNVENGASGTDVSLTVADLTRAPKSILVHRSAQDIDTVVACADIVVPIVAAGGATAGVSVLPPGGEPQLPLRPVVASLLLAVGSVGLYLRRRTRFGA